MDAENAVAEQSLRHPDGWGIGWFVDDDAYVIKSAMPAHSCPRFRQISSRIMSQTFLVHVRRATVGVVDPANAHPFRCGRWLFAHNGTVFGFEQLRPWFEDRIAARLRNLVLGDTDSEHLFFYLLSALERAGLDRTGHDASDATTVASALRAALAEVEAEAMALGIPRPIVNVLLTDGRLFLAHRAGMPLHYSTQKASCADFAGCTVPVKVCMERTRPEAPVNHFVVATERIGHENLWEDVPDGATLVVDEQFRFTRLAPPPNWVVPEVPKEWVPFCQVHGIATPSPKPEPVGC